MSYKNNEGYPDPTACKAIKAAGRMPTHIYNVSCALNQAFGLDTYKRKFPGLGEYYHSGRESGTQRSPSEYAQDLVEFMNDLHEEYEIKNFYVCLDPSAKGLQEEIRRATRTGLEYSVLIRDADNDVALGISRVQKAFVFDILSISPKQEDLTRELGTYEYDKKSIEKGKEVPVKENDHG